MQYADQVKPDKIKEKPFSKPLKPRREREGRDRDYQRNLSGVATPVNQSPDTDGESVQSAGSGGTP